ncbi:hypothetical protein E6H36_09120 [Candidatus Bathyarchaeota archaeon]|nr:MAG: hypothetical protein E6H36_09120 [Candidatus Bathyarchaeota archaeon]TMI30188.1 MAG: hypothetical protein E6H29_09455 [Candidatus Bathyarchaeota archaeon]
MWRPEDTRVAKYTFTAKGSDTVPMLAAFVRHRAKHYSGEGQAAKQSLWPPELRMSEAGRVTLLIFLSLQVVAFHVSATGHIDPGAPHPSSKPVITQAQRDGQQTGPNMQSRSMPTRSKHGTTLSVHDVGVVEEAIPKTANVGDTVMVNSTVVNYGTGTEHAIVQLIVNGTLTELDSIVTIGSHSAVVSTIHWNTTDYSHGTYGLVVKVLPVQGEQILTNNILPPVFMTLNPRPASTPSSPVAPVNRFSREMLLAIVIIETLVLSLFVVGRRLTANSFLSRLRRLTGCSI